MHGDDRDFVWIPLRTLGYVIEAIGDLEEGYFVSEHLTGAWSLPSLLCLSKDARVRRTGFMSDGNGR